MPTFESITVDDAHQIVSSAIPEKFELYQQFYDGDHWQAGKGFVDTAPLSTSETTYGPFNHQVSTGLQRLWCFQNLIAEVCDRRKDALTSKPFRMVTPASMTDEERAVLESWCLTKMVHAKISELITNVCLHQRAVLRLWIPPRHTTTSRSGSTLVKSSSFAEALNKIEISQHSPQNAAFYEDTYNARRLGVVAFDPISSTEYYLGAEPSRQKYAEVCYVNDQGMTVIRVLSEKRNQKIELDLRGRMTAFEVQADPFLTEAIINGNAAYNTTLTMLMFANRESNFLQRVYENAMPPGKWTTDEDGAKQFVPDTSFKRGPADDIYLAPIEIPDEISGETKVIPARVKTIQPSDAKRHIDTLNFHRQSLYRQVRQLHVEISKDSSSTGEARKQAAADFFQDVHDFKKRVEPAVSWVLQTVYILGKLIAGEEVRADPNEIKAEMFIDLGPITAALRETTVREVQERIKSRKTAMQEAGIIDPEAEIRQIREERENDIKDAAVVSEAIERLSKAGLPAQQINKLLSKFGVNIEGELEPPTAGDTSEDVGGNDPASRQNGNMASQSLAT